MRDFLRSFQKNPAETITHKLIINEAKSARNSAGNRLPANFLRNSAGNSKNSSSVYTTTFFVQPPNIDQSTIKC